MKKLKAIAEWFQNFNIELYFVGGCVRDWEMGNTPDDIDICVVGGKTAKNVHGKLEVLKGTNNIDGLTSVYGKFPIWIVEIDGIKYEFAMARTERKIGESHTDFDCKVQDVTIEEDLGRRDFTMNAIAKHVVTGKLVDPYNGLKSIKERIIQPVSEAFMEDPLRVYRAARFSATLDFYFSEGMLMYAWNMSGESISNERVGIELKKVMQKAAKPSRFFKTLFAFSWLPYHFKEIYDLIGVPQSPTHHPEGDAFEHTMQCIDVSTDPFIRIVMLCHDLGKVTHTTVEEIDWQLYKLQESYILPIFASIKSPGHEEAGVEPTKNMLKRISYTSHKEINKIATLVRLHMIRIYINPNNKEKTVRQYLRELIYQGLDYRQLIDVVYCDLAGRKPKHPIQREVLDTELGLSIAIELSATKAMVPIVNGEKLLEIGVEPSEEFGTIIDHALRLQDRGTLTKTNWLKVMKGAGYKSLQKYELPSNNSD